jgi:hypothetical protein
MSIKSIPELQSLFPPGSIVTKSAGEMASPCPFCYSDGREEVEYLGKRFVGTDRLIWRYRGGVYCRHCALAGRGMNGNGFYSWDMLADQLNAPLDDQFDKELAVEIEEDPLRMLWDETLVQRAHERVQRSYWYRFNWTDEVIDRFKLGLGTLYQADGNVNVIPMNVQHISDEEENNAIQGLYYVSGRRAGIPPKRTPGSSRSYYWKITNNENAKIAIIAEGEKDGITAAFLFPDCNIYVAFGATTWTKQKTQLLAECGYTEIWAFGDNDQAGAGLNRNICLWANALGMQSQYLNWDDTFEEHTDITDVLASIGREKTIAFINDHLTLSEESAAAGVTRALYVANLEQAEQHSEFIDLSELRGVGINSLRGRINKYLKEYKQRKRRGRGVLQLLATPPGSGKTHTLIKVAEDVALTEYEKRVEKQQELLQQIGNLEQELRSASDADERAELQGILDSLKKRADTFSFASVAWYGQYKDGYSDLLATGANPDLWYNFEARNSNNCANIDTVNLLAQNNHDIGAFCHRTCPFQRECQRSGYLSQDVERKKYPITFFRFQHMQSDRAEEYTQLNIVDENPSGLIDNNPTTFKAKDLFPFNEGWDLDLDDRRMGQAIDMFAAAVRNVIGANGEVLSGNRVLSLFDQQVQVLSNNEFSLETLIEYIHYNVLVDFYQPTFLSGDTQDIRKRCLPQLHKAITNELPDYIQNKNRNLPSCIHLVRDTLELYAQEPITFSASVPLIVADATALPILYDAMFKREVDVYAPQVKNENAEIIVVHGSDWTKSQIAQEIGKQIAGFKKDNTLISEDIYDQRIVRDAINIISGLSEKHDKLLVITHKNIRELFEKLVGERLKNISWGHYGALRGSNAYADFEAVVLIGAFRIPYDVMYRRISAWARLLGLDDELPTDTVIKAKSYDGQTVGHGYRTFDHWFADMFVNMIEAGEMIQSAERIRPHSSDKKKYVYMVASRPALNHVSKVVAKREFMKQFMQTKEDHIRDFLIEYKRVNREYPPYRLVTEKFATSNSVVQKIRQKLESSDEKET